MHHPTPKLPMILHVSIGSLQSLVVPIHQNLFHHAVVWYASQAQSTMLYFTMLCWAVPCCAVFLPQAHRAVLRSDPGSGSRRALWKRPVPCNLTGAITLSALEGRSGRDSPQTLVTCIVRADWGGWLSSKSTMYALGQVGQRRSYNPGVQGSYDPRVQGRIGVAG
jgi:hypothetical protein